MGELHQEYCVGNEQGAGGSKQTDEWVGHPPSAWKNKSREPERSRREFKAMFDPLSNESSSDHAAKNPDTKYFFGVNVRDKKVAVSMRTQRTRTRQTCNQIINATLIQSPSVDHPLVDPAIPTYSPTCRSCWNSKVCQTNKHVRSAKG